MATSQPPVHSSHLQPLMHIFHHHDGGSAANGSHSHHSHTPPQPPPPIITNSISTNGSLPASASTASTTSSPSSPKRSVSWSPVKEKKSTPPRARAHDGAPLPAPRAIPARQRANTAGMCRPSILSSSPTQTPFSLPPDSVFRLSPPLPPSSVIYEERSQTRTSSPKAAAVGSGPKPGTKPAPTRSRSTPPIAIGSLNKAAAASKNGAPGKTKTRQASDDNDISGLLATTMTLATSSCAADAFMTGDISGTRPTPQRRTSSASKRWTRKLFGGETTLLGPLDPNRVAASTAPEPIPTVVFGAETETGVEVCRSLLAARCYSVVALVVDIDTPVTGELRAANVPVIQVDMDNPATYENRLMGAKAVYLSTNALTLHAILQHQPEPRRTEFARAADKNQITKAVTACVRAKVGHLVFRVNACGHEVIENVLGKDGDGRGGVEGKKSFAAKELDRFGIPHTVIHTSVPFSRITQWLEEHEDGSLRFDVPVPDDTDIPWFAIEQTGEYVLAALRNPNKWLGRDMHAITDVMSPALVASKLQKLGKRRVTVPHVTRAEFDSLETHERLACKWDAWAQIVRHEYDFETSARATKADVPDQWCFDAWFEHDRQLVTRLKAK